MSPKEFIVDKDFALGKDIYLSTINYIQEKHSGQFRRFSLAPYWVHPIQVACLVQKYKESHKIDELVIAALLHDVVEDCGVTIKEIKEKFGDLVASLVDELTSDDKQVKEKGKEVYLSEKVLNMSSWGLVIKLCDRLNNVSDLFYAEEKFKNKYKRETITILNSLENGRELSDTHKEIMKDIFVFINLF